MKKTLIRIVALLMVLSCAITLFGCAEEEEPTRRRRNPTKETTEETISLPIEQEATWPINDTVPAETEKETVAPTETTAAPALEEKSLIPGSAQLPATQLLDYTYEQLRKLEWSSSNTQEGEMWVLQAKSCWTDFTFVFHGEYLDPNAKPSFLTIDDLDGDGYAYVAQGIKINDPASGMPSSIQDKIAAMDGGFYAMAVLDGFSATMMFLETRDMQPGTLCNVQFRQEV